MRSGLWGAAVGICIACGGRATSFSGTAGASGAAQVAATGGGTESAGADSAGAAGVGGVGGAPASTPDYVPDHAVPFDQAYFEGGSFESSPGNGWDACDTHTPALPTRTHNEASEGMFSFEFSSGGCSDCQPDAPSASQIYLWFTQQPASAMSLYFDVVNLTNTMPLGELRLETVDATCLTLRPLATIPLSDLAFEQTWQTRCIDLPAFGSDYALGVAVTGASFDIALDAFRLGPPCHAR